jgi:tellurite resistance protein
VRELHPDAPPPIVVGNCQGGWATALLAASNPDVTGPIVVNGAPLAYWSGTRARRHPMRYLGGLSGGTLPAMVLSDLGGGEFDGANLVLNFETFSPAAVWWRKYYDLYAGVDRPERYLDFEKWWGGFHFMTEEEIRWIVKNLFVGNRLARQGVHLDSRTFVDLRNIRSPIIVFASHGDDITPPQQALNWIADLYRDVQEIRVKGQRIIYCLHKDVGHLGIFVSSKVAKEQHSEIVSTMKTIEALPPGLYEMVIEDKRGEGIEAVFTVSFTARSIDDVVALNDHRDDEELFGAVARLSDLGENLYDLALRPWVRRTVTAASAKALAEWHPLRVRRWGASSRNPALAALAPVADRVRADRRPTGDDNPLVAAERVWAELVEESWNLARDLRHAALEVAFFAIYGNPWMRALANNDLGVPVAASDRPLVDSPEVQMALAKRSEGGFADAVIRMMILMAKSRGAIRRSRLERSNHMLRHEEPFASLSPEERGRIIHEQSLIVEFDPEAAVATLTDLLATPADRERALDLVLAVAGPADEMVPETLAVVARLRATLALPADATVPSAPA